jgi:hypothetical protein
MPAISTLTLIAALSSRDQGKIAAWAAFGACVGLYLFFRGFKMLQFKRLIVNTPTSRVRSAAMGLVELTGRPVGPSTIPAGITGAPCYYYRATASEYQRSGNNSEWKRVADESLFVPFFLQDDTGRMLINAQSADMDVHRTFREEFGSSLFGSGGMPVGTVQDFVLRYGLSGRHLRLEEYCIQPDYPLFVLGSLGENTSRWASTPETHRSAPSSSISLRMNSANSLLRVRGGVSAVRMEMSAAAATNRVPHAPSAPRAAAAASNWSSVSMDEVHKPVAAAAVPAGSIPQALPVSNFSQSAASQPIRPGAVTSIADMAPLASAADSGFELNAPVAIGKGDRGAPFTISCQSQRELVSALGWKSAACIWGGPALTVACIYVFLLTLGVM